MDIAAWLRDLGLERYEKAFRENEIDAEILPKLTADDLKDLGVSTVGHRRKLLEAIAALAEPGLAPQAEPSTPAVAAPRARRAEAERRQLTVLFCDLVGSTELAARLDPEDLREVMRAYQAACADVVGRFEGHVARFLGDGVLAYFGWPRAHEDDAERAVRAGLQLVQDVARLEPRAEIRLQARVGVATGHVVVGDLISGGVSDRDAVSGETPNLAARLQAVAAPASVVISPSTRRLVGGLFELTDLGPQRLKGFAEPLSAWRVGGEGRAEGRFEALHGEHLTPPVGREHELGILLERWAWAKDGEGQTVLLSGEPGIGKSRLTRSLIEGLADEPHTRLRFYCSPYHTNSALFPVIDQLQRAAGFQTEDTADTRLDKLELVLAEATENLAEVAPLIAALLLVPTGARYPPLNLTPESQKLRTFEALLRQAVGLAERRPVLMVLEDAHWIDPTSAELFGLVVDRIQHLPVLLLITFRPEFTPPWTGYAHITSLILSRLGQRQGAQMVERLTGGKPLPAEVLEQILAKTDGVPLFVEELTKTVLESGLLRDVGDHYELSSPLPPLAIPTTLHDSLMARLDRLAPVKEVAQIGAAIGREFSHELLAAVSSRSEDTLGEALDQLVASALVFRRGTGPNATYSFKHALVQDAAYQSLLKSKRQQLHARIAAVLEEHFRVTVEAQPELLAQHYAGAGRTTAAARQYATAAQTSTAKGAGREALALVAAGLRVLDELPDGDERAGLEAALQVARGDALRLVEGTEAPATGEAYRRARQLSVRLEGSPALGRAIHGECLHHRNRAELNEAYALASQLLEMSEQDGGSASKEMGLEVAALSSFSLGELTRARRHFEQCLSARPSEDRAQPGGWRRPTPARVYFAWDLLLLGYPSEARRRTDVAIADAERAGEPFAIALTVGNAPFVFELLRDRCRLREVVERLHEVAEAVYMPHWALTADLFGTFLLVDEGAVNEAIPRLDAGIKTSLARGYMLEVPYYLARLSQAYLVAGQVDDARTALDEAIERSERTGERWVEPELYRQRGQLRLADPARDDAGAARDLEWALGRAQAMNARFWELRAVRDLARLCADQGKRTQARDLLAPIYGWFTEGFDTADLKDAKALLDELA